MVGQRWKKSSCRWFERKIGKGDQDWDNIYVVKLRGKDKRMSVSRALDGERDKCLKIDNTESSQSTIGSTQSRDPVTNAKSRSLSMYRTVRDVGDDQDKKKQQTKHKTHNLLTSNPALHHQRGYNSHLGTLHTFLAMDANVSEKKDMKAARHCQESFDLLMPKSDMYPELKLRCSAGPLDWQGKKYAGELLSDIVRQILWKLYDLSFTHKLLSLDHCVGIQGGDLSD